MLNIVFFVCPLLLVTSLVMAEERSYEKLPSATSHYGYSHRHVYNFHPGNNYYFPQKKLLLIIHRVTFQNLIISSMNIAATLYHLRI